MVCVKIQVRISNMKKRQGRKQKMYTLELLRDPEIVQKYYEPLMERNSETKLDQARENVRE